MRKKKSILFVRPDFHCSFLYRDEFRRNGWIADIYVNSKYPSDLLYSRDGILQPPSVKLRSNFFSRFLNHGLLVFWWLGVFWRYEYHVYYGRPPAINFLENKIGLTKLFGNDFLVELWLAKIFKIKLVYRGTGCNDEESRAEFEKLDFGRVCGNCGFSISCSDEVNNKYFSIVRRYFDIVIGFSSLDSSQFEMRHFKYKSIDLGLWSPSLVVPDEHLLPKSSNIRVLHSSFLKKSGRIEGGKNIKGSPAVLAAVERLQQEGFAVELIFIDDKPSNQMRYYQVQADIIVDQLIYGWWGSTLIEGAALGKPVVCYLRQSWKKFFLELFPEYKSLPVIEADTSSIYDVLKKLISNHDYRIKKGVEARIFAEQHFDPAKNTLDFIAVLEGH